MWQGAKSIATEKGQVGIWENAVKCTHPFQTSVVLFCARITTFLTSKNYWDNSQLPPGLVESVIALQKAELTLVCPIEYKHSPCFTAYFKTDCLGTTIDHMITMTICNYMMLLHSFHRVTVNSSSVQVARGKSVVVSDGFKLPNHHHHHHSTQGS